MKRVQREAVGWAASGSAVVLAALVATIGVGVGKAPPPPAAALVFGLTALTYLVVSNLLLVAGLRRRGTERFGPANAVTSVRSTLVGFIAGLVAASFAGTVATPVLVWLVVPALALDAVDGWVARRTRTTSELGARFDMEVDAFLLLVLSAYVAPRMGLWVVSIGAARYLFVAAAWVIPWLGRPLPFRYWRKVVTAFAGIALAVAVSGLLPGLDAVLVVAALGLLVESFGRDVVWLVRQRGAEVR